MRKHCTIILFCVYPFFIGCGATGPSKALNFQNYQASVQGKELVKGQDDIEQIFTDIGLNSQAIASDIGAPEQEEPYSTEVSARLREEQKAAIKARAFWNIAGTLLKKAAGTLMCGEFLIAGGGLLGLLGVAAKGIFNSIKEKKNGMA